MTPDSLAVAGSALALLTLLQASGLALYVEIHAAALIQSRAALRRLGFWLGVGGGVLVLGTQLLEPARLAGEFAGWRDPAMQRLAWTSSGGQAALLRMGGALLLAAGFSRRAGFARARAGDTALALARVLALAGGMLVIVSPAVTGHTSVHALRWLLAPLLMVHSGIVAFWLGALAPLLLAVTREPPAVAARLLQRFSAVATWLVPVIALAGLAMALILCPGLGVLGQPYGRLLAGKLAAFLVLVVLAALNRWRYTPQLAAGQSAATTALRRTIATEYLLIALVLALTAMLTGWYGPEG